MPAAYRLLQVITNLLSNAIKFSAAGGDVTVAIETQAGTVRISVRDHGPGILPKFKPRIFEKFAQADAADARQRSGIGLGLSIVKQIVTRLGGEVSFDDAPGGGTVFHVTLPRWRHAAGDPDLHVHAESIQMDPSQRRPDAAAAASEADQVGGLDR